MRFHLLCVAVALATWATCVAADDEATYTLKRDTARTGSRIKRIAVTGHMLPYDKTYSELTTVEQGRLKAQYEQMDDGDEPPFPVEGLGHFYGSVSEMRHKLRISEGDLDLVVDVNSRGAPTSVSVFLTPDDKLGRFAASELMRDKYKPALCSGQPCAMQLRYSVHFIRGPN